MTIERGHDRRHEAVESLPGDGTDPLEKYRVIRGELTLHDARLGTRPEILVVSKCELPGAAAVRDALAAATGRVPSRASWSVSSPRITR